MAEEAAEAKQAPAAPAKPSGGQKPTLFIILAIINMLVIAGVAFMVWQGNKKREAQPNIDDVIQGQAKEQGMEKEEAPYIGKLIPLETFLVNLAGSRGRKLAKINMELEVEGERVEEEIDKRKPQIRDIIIIMLSSKTHAQVSTKEGKDFLRTEIRDTVNAFLTKGKIKSVFFTEFIYN